MKLFFLLLIATSFCWATDYTYNTSNPYGLWGTAANWSPNGVPGTTCGDTVSIPDGMIVTVNQNICIGTSGASGTVAVNLNNSGQLKLDGGSLTVRGDIFYASNGCANKTNAVLMYPGSTITFDSSTAASPLSTHYQFRSDGGDSCRPFISQGSSSRPNTITSKSTGGAAQFSGSSYLAGSFVATYTNISNIGDASNYAFQVFFRGIRNTGNGNPITWNVTNSTFTNCGVIQGDGGSSVNDTGVFIHSYNIHSQTAGPAIFAGWPTLIGLSGGTRLIRNNVFDVSVSRDGFYPGSFTFWSNYMGDGMVTGPGGWTAFQGNFVRYTSYWASVGNSMRLAGDISDSYLFIDSDWGNPKPIAQNPSIAANLTGLVYGQAGTGQGPPGITDSGELAFSNNSTNPGTQYGVYNSIFLPNMIGHSPTEIGALTSAMTNMLAIAEHNTYFGGYGSGGPGHTDGFGAVDVEEDNPSAAGQLASFRSNILWNPELQVDSQGNSADYTSSFFKVLDLWPSAPTTDICTPANCDYNAGWNHTLTFPAGTFTNQGKGYVGKFSSAPGVHDVDVNPKFVDPYRNMELWDSKYLGNNPTAWGSGSTYAVGDFVQWRRQDVYWALPVNYRYINSGACAGTNPEPGHGTNWRDCWEWASLYRLRQAIAAGTTYDDPVIGANGDDVIITLLKWVRSGYSPTNSLLAGAAHDGSDIGAVPVSFPPPQVTQVSTPTSSGARTGVVRGGVIR
jgi:hypothetical protein